MKFKGSGIMLYEFNIKFNDGRPDKKIIAETFVPANGNKIYFKTGQKYVAMYREDQIADIDMLGEYVPPAPQSESSTEETATP